jgi:hypothetical protein
VESQRFPFNSQTAAHEGRPRTIDTACHGDLFTVRVPGLLFSVMGTGLGNLMSIKGLMKDKFFSISNFLVLPCSYSAFACGVDPTAPQKCDQSHGNLCRGVATDVVACTPTR